MKELFLLAFAVFINSSFANENSKPDLTLWATNYYTPIYKVSEEGHALLSMKNYPLEYKKQEAIVTQKQWCFSAMEGSVALDFGDKGIQTFNYAGTDTYQVDCSDYFGDRFPATSKVRFKTSRSKFGEGTLYYNLIPYKTIAVDHSFIEFGSVIYIPQAKGTKIKRKDGKVFIHDGYFFAGDKGGGIKGNHIDIFTGNSKSHKFSFIKNNEQGTFKAYLVKDQKVVARMLKDHLKNW